jgi:DNA-binding Lrp family transcriptional regulator
MRTVQQTSINAFSDILNDGSAESQCELIMEVLKRADVPLSQGDIARIVRLPPGRISARFGSLKKRGWVKEYGKKVDPKTKKTVIAWVRTDNRKY